MSKVKDIVIIGTGGLAKETIWLIEDINRVDHQWNILGLVDDNKDTHGLSICGFPVLGSVSSVINENYSVVISIGSSIVREAIYNRLKLEISRYATLIHSSVIYSKSVEIGCGVIICAGAIITVDIKIGDLSIICVGSTIGHDTSLGQFVTILPGVNVAGNTVLEDACSVGSGSQVIQGLTVGHHSIIGAGSVVIKDLPQNCTAVGSPAKPIKFHQ